MDITDTEVDVAFSVHAEHDIEELADTRGCDPGVIASAIAAQLRGRTPQPAALTPLSFGRWHAVSGTLAYDFDHNGPGRITVVRVTRRS